MSASLSLPKMSSHGRGKRLSEEQRMEVIAKLRSSKPESKRAIARYYGVTENAIRQTWLKRDSIERRALFMSQGARKETFRAAIGNFTALEDELYLWIETMRRAKLEVPTSLVIQKALQIAETQNIPKEKFKASWHWLSKFRERKGLEEQLISAEGAGVDKEDPVLSQSLDALYAIISQAEQASAELASERSVSSRLEGEKTQLDRLSKEMKMKLVDLEYHVKIKVKNVTQLMETRISGLQKKLDTETRDRVALQKAVKKAERRVKELQMQLEEERRNAEMAKDQSTQLMKTNARRKSLKRPVKEGEGEDQKLDCL